MVSSQHCLRKQRHCLWLLFQGKPREGGLRIKEHLPYLTLFYSNFPYMFSPSAHVPSFYKCHTFHETTLATAMPAYVLTLVLHWWVIKFSDLNYEFLDSLQSRESKKDTSRNTTRMNAFNT